MASTVRRPRATPQAVGDEILKRLKELGISASELALRAGVGKGTVSRLVNGEVGYVRTETADAVERGLDLKLGTLFVVSVPYRVPPKCKGCGTECSTCRTAA